MADVNYCHTDQKICFKSRISYDKKLMYFLDLKRALFSLSDHYRYCGCLSSPCLRITLKDFLLNCCWCMIGTSRSWWSLVLTCWRGSGPRTWGCWWDWGHVASAPPQPPADHHSAPSAGVGIFSLPSQSIKECQWSAMFWSRTFLIPMFPHFSVLKILNSHLTPPF